MNKRRCSGCLLVNLVHRRTRTQRIYFLYAIAAVARAIEPRLFVFDTMMDYKITALKAQKRNPNRVNVYLDGDYVFSLERIVAAWLQVGQIIDEKKISQLKEHDGEEKAFQRALHLISYRQRSVHEIQKKLEALGYSEQTIDRVISRLSQNEILDDERFARDWIENRNTFRPRSQRMLAVELRQKGISEDTIVKTIENNDDTVLAYEAARQRLRRYEDLEWNEFRTKLSAFLGRRGFHYGVIHEVVSRVWSEIQND